MVCKMNMHYFGKIEGQEEKMVTQDAMVGRHH